MKHLSLLLILTVTVACGKPKTKTDSPITPCGSQCAGYITEFESRNLMAGGSPNPTNLQVLLVDDLANNILGTCTMGAAFVKINRSLWVQLNKAHREELIFHELGHCVLGRLHNNTMNGTYPESLMHSYHMGPAVYLRSTAVYQDYMAELYGENVATFAALTYNDTAYASHTQNMASIYRPEEPEYNDHSLEGMETIECPSH